MADLFNNDALPVHVGIIMDGNGRWAKKRNLLRTNGHTEGLKRAKEIAKAASDIGLKFLTFYVFSTEKLETHRAGSWIFNEPYTFISFKGIRLLQIQQR